MRRACPGSYSAFDASAKLLFRKVDPTVNTYRYWLFLVVVKVSSLGRCLTYLRFGGSLRFKPEL